MVDNTSYELSLNGSAETPSVHSSMSIALQVTFLALVILIAVVANGLVCLVIYKTPSLHNVINIFLVSMSVSDLLHALFKMSTTLISKLHRDWYPHKAICYVTTPFGVLFGAASVFNLCAVAVNQYFVIVKPLHYPMLMTSTHARWVVTSLWIGSVVISTPPIFWRSAETLCKSGAVSKGDYMSEVAYICALWFFVVIIPSIIMMWTYSNIFLTAREQILRMNQNGLSTNFSITKTRKKELRVAALLALVGGIFIICWLPFFIVMTLLKFSTVKIDREYFSVFLFVMYAKSAINPILYTVMNNDLKQACRRFFFRRLAHRESAMLMGHYGNKRNSNDDRQSSI